MKKSGNQHFDDFPAAQLYLNDLKELVSIFEDNCEEISLEIGEYENVSSNEIDQVVKELDTKKFGDIYIKGHQPYITLDLRPFGVRAYVSDDEIKQHGMLAKFRSIVDKRKRKSFGKLLNILSFVPAITAGIAIVEKEWELVALSIMLLFPIVSYMTSYQMKNTLVVYSYDSSNSSSFLVKKKDELIIAFTSALVGAITSFVLVKFFN